MNTFWRGLGLIAALQTVAAPVLAAQACSAHSPAHTVALLELYTSEGCSSCPPADQFVGGLRAAGVSADQAVLLSLHVDYWNYIGWKDPYSRAAFTERQRYLSELAGSRAIYTPEIFVAGRELRKWSDGVPAAVKRINDTPARANITIALGQAGAGGLPVTVSAAAAATGKGDTLFIALTESGISSRVTAGENQGRTLKHDVVVREWLAPVPLGRDGTAAVSRALPIPPGAVLKNLAISAFVQSERGEVLQALSQGVCL